jgi:hypothetical protein
MPKAKVFANLIHHAINDMQAIDYLELDQQFGYGMEKIKLSQAVSCRRLKIKDKTGLNEEKL